MGTDPDHSHPEPLRAVTLDVPPAAARSMGEAIAAVGGHEVFFLGRVTWDAARTSATLSEIEVLARGNRTAAPAIIERAGDWDLAIHNHPSGDLTPSGPDIDVASELGNRGVGFAIISNDGTRHRLVVPPFPRDDARSVPEDEVREIFGEGGVLARTLEGYEPRQQQMEMALEVTRALNAGTVAACEAGTGVGKSFAYLVPAIIWAERNHHRVVVTTGTIALQEQLVHKDLPFLAKVLPVRFRYCLIKGRHNYACRRKLSELRGDLEIVPTDPDEQRLLEELLAWSRSTADGSLASLSWTPPPAVWERVMSETDKSLKVSCRHYAECFYYEARRRASNSHIVVANHHLYFADLSIRRQTGNYQHDLILPGYRRVVFDEAHHIEDVASDHFGFRLTRAGLRRRLSRMRSAGGKGVLRLLAGKLARAGDAARAESLESRYAAQLPVLRDEIDRHFAAIQTAVEALDVPSLGADETSAASPGSHTTIRHRHDPRLEGLWEEVEIGLKKVAAELHRVAAWNDRAVDTVDAARVSDDVRKSVRLELTSFGGRIESLCAQLERFCDFDDDSLARWIDRRDPDARGQPRASITFAAAPVRVADMLVESVFESVEGLVLTSATLSVAGKTDFLADRLGLGRLSPDRCSFRVLSSPFDFERQVLLVLPNDLPLPTSVEYERGLGCLLRDLLQASSGRAFVLFTSYALLGRTFASLEEPIRRMGYRPLAQGTAQRSELLARFREGNCVLFGTDSFWEGVDVRGRALSSVILTRLPFRVPSEPIQEARVEDIEARGGNAFLEYTVPQAVLRFKQGFGRLIRSRDDRGVVVVLDGRVLRRPYGRVFLASLPPARRFTGPWRAALAEVRRFFEEPAASVRIPEETPPGCARPGEDARALPPEGGAPGGPVPDDRPPW